MKYTIGIDPSVVSLGYSVFKGKKMIGQGVINSLGKCDELKKSIVFLNEIKQNIDIESKQKDILFIIESQYVTPIQSNSILKLTELTGFLKGVMVSNYPDITIDGVSPGSWRKSFKIKGKKRKDIKRNTIHTVNFIYEKEGFSTQNDNIADAVLIGLYGAYKK